MKNDNSKIKSFLKLPYAALAVGAVVVVVAAITSACVFSAKKSPSAESSDTDTVEEVEFVTSTTPEHSSVENGGDFSIDFTELEPEIDGIITDIQARAGGEWSVYIKVPKTGDYLSVNQQPYQAASVIKIFIMGAVYDQYDEILEYYSGSYSKEEIDGFIRDMITVSDNECADILVRMLGRGSQDAGKEAVNEFCRNNGFTNTSMNRMMGDMNIYSDNYTTTEDCAKFLEMAYSAEFEHSRDMLDLLIDQERDWKIPAGIPNNVRVANKTGELDDVQNDVAIVFTKYPYIFCVISDGVEDYQPPIDAIVEMSSVVYEYISESM